MEQSSARSFLSPYFELVHQYSQRSLTYDLDVYNAFTGIMVRHRHAYANLQFHSGLPGTVDRRVMAAFFERTTGSVELAAELHWIPDSKRLKRRHGADYPSWCWVSWAGGIKWLEAVVLPDHWEWQHASANSLLGSGCLSLETRTIPAGLFRFHVLPTKGFPKRILSPGDGSALPLTAILDSNER